MAQELLAPMQGGAGAVLARDRTLPLAPSLVPLFPDGALRKGSTVAIGRGSAPGATSLALALLSGPSAAGSWCAMVGTPDLGFVAAAQFGADLERLVVVPSPGAKWPLVTAALLEGLDVVFLRPPGEVRQADASRLQARARERGAVLVVLGPSWAGADVRLAVVAARWLGLQDGYGHLWGREVEVAASGRGAASRERRACLWLGGPSPGIPAVHDGERRSGHDGDGSSNGEPLVGEVASAAGLAG